LRARRTQRSHWFIRGEQTGSSKVGDEMKQNQAAVQINASEKATKHRSKVKEKTNVQKGWVSREAGVKPGGIPLLKNLACAMVKRKKKKNQRTQGCANCENQH